MTSRAAIAVIFLLAGCREAPADSSAPTAENRSLSTATAEARPGGGALVTCPVCGLSFRANEAIATFEHKGHTYYFLLQDHRDAFAARPERYLTSSPPAP